MAESTLSLNFTDLKESVGYYLYGQRDPTKLSADELKGVVSHIDTGYRWFIVPSILGGEVTGHAWSFLEPTTTLTITPEVTGILNSVPTRVGKSFTIESTLDVFTSTMVGSFIVMDDTGSRFEITEFISTTKVKARGTEKINFGTAPSGKALSVLPEGSGTDITATTAKFTEDMVGDNIKFTTGGGTEYEIITFLSTTKVTVQGDASAESGNFNIQRVATTNVISGTNPTSIGFTAAILRLDMADDTVTFTLTSNVFNIFTVVSPGFQFLLTGLSEDATGETVGDTVTIKKLLTSSGSPTFNGKTVIESAERTFDASMIGMSVRFDTAPYNAFVIEELVGTVGAEVRVTGNAGAESGTFKVVQAVGTTTGLFTFTDPETTVTITVANFTSAMADMTLVFQDSGNQYTIGTFTSTTVVKVLGNAGGELPGDVIYVIGPTDEDSGDTFSITQTGADYDLPDDFGGLVGKFTFGEDDGWIPIPQVSEGQMRTNRQFNKGTARPLICALRPKDVTTSEDEGQRFEVLFDPSPDSTYTLSYKYRALPTRMTDDKPFPLGGLFHGETIKALCLAAAEQAENDEKGMHWSTAMERLNSSIKLDREAMVPATLGYNADSSESVSVAGLRDYFRAVSNRLVTVEGSLST